MSASSNLAEAAIYFDKLNTIKVFLYNIIMLNVGGISMKIIVVGGGASGLISAIFSANGKNDITILERNNICGKKILATGNGKCNYWNDDQSIRHYHSSNYELLEKIITSDVKDKVLNFFDSIGIVPKIKNGYYYPYSNQATSIQTALILQAKLLGVKIDTGILVENIIKKDNQYSIVTNDKTYFADKVILATGSKAAPKTGSDGVGYELAKKLGHTVIKPLPALVQINGKGNYFRELSGIKQDVKVSLIENNKVIKEELGEINLTDYGLSGICVMQLSGMIARGLESKKTEIIMINFMPWLNCDVNEFISWMDERSKKVLNRTVTELLDGVLNYKLVNFLIKKSNIKLTSRWQDLSKESKLDLANNIIAFKQEVISTNSFDKAQVCSGGIPLSEININTMESLKSKGLYIIGELLDVDGDCGGYNLGFAWMSGILAGNDISKEI